MILLTCIGCFRSDARFLFAMGSDSLLNMISGKIYIQSIFIVAFIMTVLIQIKIKQLIKYINIVLIFIFVLWMLSGRTIGYIPYPEEKIKTGWFYLPMNQIFICNKNNNVDIDCEKISYYETFVEVKPFWCIQVTNKEMSKVIFVGPFIWSNTLDMFKNIYPLNHPRGIASQIKLKQKM